MTPRISILYRSPFDPCSALDGGIYDYEFHYDGMCQSSGIRYNESGTEFVPPKKPVHEPRQER
jgi:hypothetical protein